MHLEDAAAGTVENDATVVFDTIVTDMAPNVSYDTGTGEFTITSSGLYLVIWRVATDGAGAATSISFEVQLNGANVAEESTAGLTGQISGTAVVSVVVTPAVITLVNVTGDSVFLGNTPVQGSMMILELLT